MNNAKIKGEVQTVLGPIKVDDLGVVLTHEHLFIDFSFLFIEPDDPHGRELAHQPVSLSNLSWVRANFDTGSLDNLLMTDEGIAISEAMYFKRAGGSTIINLTAEHCFRNPSGLVRVAQSTGLNIIMSTAYYTEESYRPDMDMDSKTEEEIAEEFVRDIVVGVGDNSVRAGIIGELGCSWPITKNERKVLQAAAIAQQRTGVPISIHPGPSEDAPLEIVNILTHSGADPTHIIIGHIDATLSSHEIRCKLAETGCYLEWDLFGHDGLYPMWRSELVDLPSDAERIRQIIRLIAEGYLDQILMSQDNFVKCLLYHFGGMGYGHILNKVVPLMRQKGVTEEQIQAIILENPKRVLSTI